MCSYIMYKREGFICNIMVFRKVTNMYPVCERQQIDLLPFSLYNVVSILQHITFLYISQKKKKYVLLYSKIKNY